MTQIVAFSGRKQSGKNTSCNFITGLEMLALGVITKEFMIPDDGRLWVSDILGDEENQGFLDITSNNPDVVNFLEHEVFPYVKVYSFADLLKQEVCMKVLGLKYEQMYGTDEQKKSATHLRWENMPAINEKKRGFMTGREVLQYVGTEIFRQMYPTVWAEGLIRRIEAEGSQLALICDTRFPDEVEAIQAAGGKVIRLTRCPFPEDTHASETALDKKNFDWNKFDAIIDNENTSVREANQALHAKLVEWQLAPEMTSTTGK